MIIYNILYDLKFKITLHPDTDRKYKVTALYNVHTIQREQMLMNLCDDGDANVLSASTLKHMRTLNDHIPGDHWVLGTDEAIHKMKLSRRCTL